MNAKTKRQKRIIRHRRVRAKIFGTPERPRLSVFRSRKHVFLQVIDDAAGRTMVSASSQEIKDGKGKTSAASAAAKLLAARAQKAGIREVVFDRGGYKFHGRVKAAAEAAAEAGLKI